MRGCVRRLDANCGCASGQFLIGCCCGPSIQSVSLWPWSAPSSPDGQSSRRCDLLSQLLERDLSLHGFGASSFSRFPRLFGRPARQLEYQLRSPDFFFGGSGFLFRRLDLFYGNTDSLFCGLRCGFDMSSVHRRPLLRLLRVRDAVIAGGRVGDGRVGEVHWLRDVLARHVGQLQPTAAAQGVAALHNITLPGDGSEANV